MPRHPRPDTPESKVEHQADQPGVTTDVDSKEKTEAKRPKRQPSH